MRRCPRCDNPDSRTERRPNGNTACNACGFKASTKLWDEFPSWTYRCLTCNRRVPENVPCIFCVQAPDYASAEKRILREAPLTDAERTYLRKVLQGLNPREDLMGAMRSKTDVSELGEMGVVLLAAKLEGLR